MSLDDAKNTFNQTIEESSWWQRFKGSEFVTYLVTFVAQIAIRAQNAATRLLQESFLSLAITPSAILAHAQSKGYVPLKRTPTKHTITITNSSGSVINIPSNTSLYSADNNLNYLIFSAVSIPANSAVNVECIQGYFETFTSQVGLSVKHLSKELDANVSDEISSFTVYITDPNGERKQWSKTHLFRNTTKDSEAFVEYYNSSRQIGVRFGNDISGKVPQQLSVIDIECVLTEGFSELPSGALLEFDDITALNADLVVSVVDTLAVGSERESIESIRNNALYYVSYDNNIVLDGDYPYFLRQNFAGLTWVSVWGESKQEVLKGAPSLDYINKIYISAYHPLLTQAEVMSEVSTIFSSVNSMNKTYVPVACIQAPYTLTVNGKTRTTNIPNDVSLAISQMLSRKYSSSAASHLTQTTVNNIYKEIEALGLLFDFTVTVQGADFDSPVPIDTFRYLDVANSSINITF